MMSCHRLKRCLDCFFGMRDDGVANEFRGVVVFCFLSC